MTDISNKHWLIIWAFNQMVKSPDHGVLKHGVNGTEAALLSDGPGRILYINMKKPE